MKEFHSNGKLLITGEYVILDGAMALAVPTRFGQSLRVEAVEQAGINWKSLDHQGNQWFEAGFTIEEIRKSSTESEIFKHTSRHEVGKKLLLILKEADQMNPGIFGNGHGFEVSTRLDFPLDWGLGTSSTLINNIARWFEIDAFDLLERTFGGSGYDIAVADSDRPVTYRVEGKSRSIFTTTFDPAFRNDLFFVHLNRKQNSRESIQHYRSQPKERLNRDIEKISGLTQSMLKCESLEEFELLIEIHENVISRLIDTPKVKTELFPDYPGAIKSLGGWGGDFILATGKEPEKEYFQRKGFNTILGYREMLM